MAKRLAKRRLGLAKTIALKQKQHPQVLFLLISEAIFASSQRIYCLSSYHKNSNLALRQAQGVRLNLRLPLLHLQSPSMQQRLGVATWLL
jgi:hypothetical protein